MLLDCSHLTCMVLVQDSKEAAASSAAAYSYCYIPSIGKIHACDGMYLFYSFHRYCLQCDLEYCIQFSPIISSKMGILDFDNIFDVLDASRRGYLSLAQVQQFDEALNFSSMDPRQVEAGVRQVCGPKQEIEKEQFYQVEFCLSYSQWSSV